jgi:hypothetical protein
MRYQPSVAKVAGNKGFHAMVQVRDHAGRLLRSKVSTLVFETKEAARNYARAVVLGRILNPSPSNG